VLLLDTCTLLWLAAEASELSARSRALIAAHPNGLHVSAISAFEIALKHRKGKLVLPAEPERWLDEILSFHAVEAIPVDRRIAARSAILPSRHGDPCDRIIVATAAAHGLTILSPDPLLRKYRQAKVVW